MPCYYPLTGYRAKHTNPSGKRSITFNKNDGYTDRPVTVGCGNCIGCRLEKSRQWAIRCLHEASLWPDNIFITLTYDNEKLPQYGSLNPKHHQDFLKRLRSKIAPKKIRFYHCGEYGDNTARPHYHTLIFNHDFADKELYTERDGIRLYVSDTLNQIWGHGFCTIGDVTFESAAYCARYVLKKVNGEKSEQHYQSVDTTTGELNPIIPEYTTMSRRPGIGALWLEKYNTDVYPHDYVVVNGKKMKPPRFYDSILEQKDEAGFDRMKSRRLSAAHAARENSTVDRLVTREIVAKARLNSKKRVI